MPADVASETTWRAYCAECRWIGPSNDTDDGADADADEHDKEHHA